MRKISKVFFAIFLNSLFWCGIFVLTSVLLVTRNYEELPLTIPIWFSKSWGEDRLAEPFFIWIFPIISIFLIVCNYVISKFLEKNEAVFASILRYSSVFISFLLFYSLFEILKVIT